MTGNHEKSSSMPGRKPRVLIAYDADTRKMLSDNLTHWGYEVIVAAEGEEALALAAEQPLDLALVDVRMPGLSGMELAKRLKELWPEMEFIIITAYGSILGAGEAVRQGAFHYLPKPRPTQTGNWSTTDSPAATRPCLRSRDCTRLCRGGPKFIICGLGRRLCARK